MIESAIGLFTGTLKLFIIGLCGWAIFASLRVPMSALLGSLTIMATLRILQIPIASPPDFLSPLLQIVLGLFVGSMVTRDKVHELRKMFLPAVIIISWALTIMFSIGIFLAYISPLDIFTAILSSSVGGLPEMTVIALEMEADIAVVVFMQSFRMISTLIIFPFIYQRWVDGDCNQNDFNNIKGSNTIFERFTKIIDLLNTKYKPLFIVAKFKDIFNNIRERQSILYKRIYKFVLSMKRGILSFGIASVGGYLFWAIGVPAGAMVGAVVFIIFISIAGIDVKPPPQIAFSLLHVGLGILVSENINADTLYIFSSVNILIPVILSSILIILSSFLVALIIHKVIKWDFPTCFLSVSPAGFAVMISLAIKYNKNPFKVSILHLCRLLAIKTLVPAIFMLYKALS